MRCRECGEQIADREVRSGYDVYPYGEGSACACTHAVCPVCGSDDLAEECACAQCGEEVSQAELKNGFCRFCEEELSQTLEWIRSMLTPMQLRWMREHPEWSEQSQTEVT